MTGDQSARLTMAFARQAAQSSMAGLCTACVEVLGVTGSGLARIGTDPRNPMCASDFDAASLEYEQYAVGVEPGPDAARSGVSVRAARLDAIASKRWPSFVEVTRDRADQRAFAYLHQVSRLERSEC